MHWPAMACVSLLHGLCWSACIGLRFVVDMAQMLQSAACQAGNAFRLTAHTLGFLADAFVMLCPAVGSDCARADCLLLDRRIVS